MWAYVRCDQWKRTYRHTLVNDFRKHITDAKNEIIRADIIIKNKQQFAPVIKLQTAYDILRNADMNPDVVVSRFQSNISHTDVRYELDGSAATNKRGMGIELDKAYAALEVETQGMDKVCLGCNNRGIRFRTA